MARPPSGIRESLRVSGGVNLVMPRVARTYGMVLDGIAAVPVTLEGRQMPVMRTHELRVVGLPDAAVREGMHRVRSALWPFVGPVITDGGGGILINLSPADLKKTGRILDLALAMAFAGVLLGRRSRERLVFVGEVGLDGEVRPVSGVLAAAVSTREAGFDGLVCPRENLAEARLLTRLPLYPVASVREALDVLGGAVAPDAGPRGAPAPRDAEDAPDLAEVRGQLGARRALEIAAAGRHNLLMEGPPGSGKTMLARRMPGILPRLDEASAMESALIRSVLRHLDPRRLHEPTFRAPHHTASPAGLVGGGRPLQPGELTLAHHGVLFLDEFPEFDRRALEVLREPMEAREVQLTRVGSSRSFPADFLCIAAMNPCPCGHHGLDDGRCRCTPRQVQTYRHRLSGPILDRFDLRIRLLPVPAERLMSDQGGEGSAAVRARVEAARDRQRARFGAGCNATVPDAVLRAATGYGAGERAFLVRLMTGYRLSARAIRRLERVARTLADLAGEERVREGHLMEAVGFRLGRDFERRSDASQGDGEDEEAPPRSGS